jgi:uncharacterized membrane protein
MTASWEAALIRWTASGLIEDSTALRIRDWEAGQVRPDSHRFAALAFGLGGLLLAAGFLLFIAAHWDALGAGARFGLVLGCVALLHGGATASAERIPLLARTLHAAGTGALGAGIFLCGQIFNLAEHWPSGLLLWALGAAGSYLVLRDWPDLIWTAILVPAWLWGEWSETHWRLANAWDGAPPLIGTLLLALAYLAAPDPGDHSVARRALARLGAIMLYPALIALAIGSHAGPGSAGSTDAPPALALALAWTVALATPLGLALLLRGRGALHLAPHLELRLFIALLWSLVAIGCDTHAAPPGVAFFGVYALGGVGLAAWGIRERRRLLFNLGVGLVALALAGFYFSNVFDALGRSLGLFGLGILLLGGGFLLERTRRRVLARMGV